MMNQNTIDIRLARAIRPVVMDLNFGKRVDVIGFAPTAPKPQSLEETAAAAMAAMNAATVHQIENGLLDRQVAAASAAEQDRGLASMTKFELLELAASKGIKVFKSWTKEKIVAALSA